MQGENYPAASVLCGETSLVTDSVLGVGAATNDYDRRPAIYLRWVIGTESRAVFILIGQVLVLPTARSPRISDDS
jgi:hypothetical protein